MMTAAPSHVLLRAFCDELARSGRAHRRRPGEERERERRSSWSSMAPTLVLLHGFTHSGASWNRVTAELGERYRPLAPDIRGQASASAATPVDLHSVLD